jgi:lysophospholipase L1-like esterase
MRNKLYFTRLVAAFCLSASIELARSEIKSIDPALAKFQPVAAPRAVRGQLKSGDRLAICGDSITEQKMYSRLMEDYLTVCVPQLGVSVRQYGWSGERAPGFLNRMTNDCLRFQPTLATTCYGMNDHEYRPYEPRIGEAYRANSLAVVRAFKAHGARVVQGSPGCVGKMPSWVKSASGGVEDLNLNLCNLRNLGVEIARQEKVGFADVFWPMMLAGSQGQQRYGTNFLIAGNDGVHPGWAGQAIMAYAFLKSFGLEGNIATLTVDLKRHTLKATAGHELVSAANGEFTIRSERYPFCACNVGFAAKPTNPPYPDCNLAAGKETDSLRAALALTKFDDELNRFLLVVKNARAANYTVTWGAETKAFTGAQLRQGINLAAEFPANPFTEAFARVDAAVAAKQAYETKQIKQIFHGEEGKRDQAAAADRTEKEREPLAAAVKTAFVPVTHTLRIAEGK